MAGGRGGDAVTIPLELGGAGGLGFAGQSGEIGQSGVDGGGGGGGAAGGGNGGNGGNAGTNNNNQVPGGNGGAGGSSAGGNGSNGIHGFGRHQDPTSGGGGGGGGANGNVIPIYGILANEIRAGGNGGNGGAAGDDGTGFGGGGGGGAGGFGAVLTFGVTNRGSISGGNGGHGGHGSIDQSGSGGDGGVGVQLSEFDSSFVNLGLVIGGNGGLAGSSSHPGDVGTGGVGIVGQDDMLVFNSGTISGGLSGFGARADAIRFSGGFNLLAIQSTSIITGNVVAGGTDDVLELYGFSNGTFDISQIGDTAQYRGFERFAKFFPSTWTLTGTATTTMNWEIGGGALLINGALAAGSNVLASNGATLGGTGEAQQIQIIVGGILAPGLVGAVGTFTANNGVSLGLGATLAIQLGGAAAGQYDVLRVNGTVTLGNDDATLSVSFLNNFQGIVGDRFVIIENDKPLSSSVTGAYDAIDGAFNGLNQDAIFSVGNTRLQISYTGGDGNDVELTVVAPLSGGNEGAAASEDDLLIGTEGPDTLAGLAGQDTVTGLGGDDLLLGNTGNDDINGGSGNDTVYGGRDSDRIAGGSGNDLLFGNEGSDTIDAGDGDNTVVGGQDSTDGADLITAGVGNDLILGNGGNDSVSAGAGNDVVVGGFGDDLLFGNMGNDFIFGNQDNDLIFGGTGDDTLVGGMGNDTLYGNEGNDVLFGNEGADRLVFGTNFGMDVVNGFSSREGDRLDLQGQTYTTTQDNNGNAVLTLSGGGIVTLTGVAATQVGAGFFA